MYITHIDIAGLSVESQDSMIRAHVAITSGQGRVLLDCRIPDTPMEPALRKSAVLTEAIRQLRRMPEYRSGKREIEMAEGLLI